MARSGPHHRPCRSAMARIRISRQRRDAAIVSSGTSCCRTRCSKQQGSVRCRRIAAVFSRSAIARFAYDQHSDDLDPQAMHRCRLCIVADARFSAIKPRGFDAVSLCPLWLSFTQPIRLASSSRSSPHSCRARDGYSATCSARTSHRYTRLLDEPRFAVREACIR